MEYKNGSRHTIGDYADMAIRTASKRAYLTGEGEKRKEWGISTVIVNKRGNPCPKCLPFCGKVLIDDVWSGGSKDGVDPETGKKYPTMSYAISKGLYHPRCKDGHTTYFPGISSEPDDRYSNQEIEEISKKHTVEQKRQIAKRNYEKYSRLAKHSLDEENRKKYSARSEEWKNQYSVYYKQEQLLDKGSSFDKDQFDRYQKVLGDNVPDNLDDFLKLKYNDKEKYGKLKHAYRIVNSYETNAGDMSPDKIYELDDKAFHAKQLFTGKARKQANIAVMEIDGNIKYANSQIDNIESTSYINYRGDKKLIVLKTETPKFKTSKVGSHCRDMDSEAKLLEYAAAIAKDRKPHTIDLLSEKCMCDSCLGVLQQFKDKYPAVTINVVSNKKERAEKNKNKPWAYRKR